jgi:hypothetical protein
VLIGAEAVVGAGGYKRCLTFPKLQLLSVGVEHPAAFEDDIELVIGVCTLMVRLWRDKRIHADLKPGRLVDDLVPTVSGAKARFGPGDVESMSRIQRFLPLRLVGERGHRSALRVVD